MLLDRGEGQFAVSLAPATIPTGNVQSVTHSVSRRGQAVVAATTVTMPPMTVPASVWSLMPEGPRRLLRGLQQ